MGIMAIYNIYGAGTICASGFLGFSIQFITVNSYFDSRILIMAALALLLCIMKSSLVKFLTVSCNNSIINITTQIKGK